MDEVVVALGARLTGKFFRKAGSATRDPTQTRTARSWASSSTSTATRSVASLPTGHAADHAGWQRQELRLLHPGRGQAGRVHRGVRPRQEPQGQGRPGHQGHDDQEQAGSAPAGRQRRLLLPGRSAARVQAGRVRHRQGTDHPRPALRPHRAQGCLLHLRGAPLAGPRRHARGHPRGPRPAGAPGARGARVALHKGPLEITEEDIDKAGLRDRWQAKRSSGAVRRPMTRLA
jgi:hypothetical protein